MTKKQTTPEPPAWQLAANGAATQGKIATLSFVRTGGLPPMAHRQSIRADNAGILATFKEHDPASIEYSERLAEYQQAQKDIREAEANLAEALEQFSSPCNDVAIADLEINVMLSRQQLNDAKERLELHSCGVQAARQRVEQAYAQLQSKAGQQNSPGCVEERDAILAEIGQVVSPLLDRLAAANDSLRQRAVVGLPAFSSIFPAIPATRPSAPVPQRGIQQVPTATRASGIENVAVEADRAERVKSMAGDRVPKIEGYVVSGVASFQHQ